jgi:DNA ligase 1
MKTDGLVFKRRGSAYGCGSCTDEWWIWKRDPLRLSAVLVAAQESPGERTGIFNDYTFALWHKGDLLSFARAQSGLSREETLRLDSFIRKNTKARWGPVHEVKPELVFDLLCDGIQPSGRYKSGIAARACRILSWRQDVPAPAADLLDKARELSL